MKLPMYQVDAFTETLFGGNPAAVCPLPHWIPEQTMQQIAKENNLSETAFFVKEGSHYHIRWFTPAVEVALCGHATLASSHVLFHHLGYHEDTLIFQSGSGELRVTKKDDRLILDFPADPVETAPAIEILTEGLGVAPTYWYKGKTDYMLIYDSQNQIETMKPDHGKLRHLPFRGIMVTAPGDEVDFVSRFFAYGAGIDEDPVTGSAHTTLIPYWSQRLGKTKMKAIQLSSRKGLLDCEFLGSRVLIGGHCVTYLTGNIDINE